MQLMRERLLELYNTKQYVVLPPDETVKLQREVTASLNSADPGLNDVDRMALMEMNFYLLVYIGEEIEADVLYRTLVGRIGENSPRMHLMKATLLQVTEGDPAAAKYLKNLLEKQLEYDTDSVDYLQVSKKLIALERPALSTELWMKKLLSLLEKFPLDAELWWTLAMEYYKLGQFDQAIYCFEEVLLISPLAYSAFAQLAEVLYCKAMREKPVSTDVLQEALENALRAVELSSNCLKGWSFVGKISSVLEKPRLLSLALTKLREIESSSNKQHSKTAKYILKSLE
ncbi:FACR173Wp [Eremothecium gossypii FDAG1]|nr:FACR173Wp [Eremothecium gossypii FDAG1]